jgi:hypothetical protein
MNTKRAKLGMRVTGSTKAEGEDADGPPPGSPEFGERALRRLQLLRRKRPIVVDPDLGKDDKTA